MCNENIKELEETFDEITFDKFQVVKHLPCRSSTINAMRGAYFRSSFILIGDLTEYTVPTHIIGTP